MSWVRNNVSKTISQQRAFNKSATSYQVNTPKNSIETESNNKVIESNNKVIEKLPSSIYNIKKSALDYLDAILYINLKHREDRKEHCLDEIRKIDKYLIKTYRIDAVYDEELGARGCIASHIKALEYFIENKYWNNVLILEDDFTFISDNKETINQSISYLLNTH
jgi:F0F1-type ATP synthase beta subunit